MFDHYTLLIYPIHFCRFELIYYGTNQSGMSKKGGSDLVQFSEENLEKFKSRDSRRKDLQKAILEADGDHTI